MVPNRIARPNVTSVGAIVACLLIALPAQAQRTEPAPPELENVGVTEHLDARIPLDLPFVDSSGKKVTLRDVFDGRRPVVLTLNYSSCPMLCSLQLNGLFQGFEKLNWDIGEKFQLLTVSIDPKESPKRAAQTKKKYLEMYGRPGSEAGYHFLVGEEKNIRKLASAVGFRYAYLPKQEQYAHAAVTMIVTPDGRVSRYLYGVEYAPQTLKLSLLEASEGKIGTPMEQILMFCFHYDATSGRYGLAAFNLMRIAAAVTVVLLAGVLLAYWYREMHKAEAR